MLSPESCVSSCIVLRKQKTGSLCPAFKSTQSSVSSAPRAVFLRPSSAHTFLFSLILRLGILSCSSAHCPLSLLAFFRTETTLLLLISSYVQHLWFFPFYIFFFFSFVYSLCTLTRSNSQLLSRPRIPLILLYNFVLPSLFSRVRACSSWRRSLVDEVSRRHVEVFFLQCCLKKHRKFLSHTNKYSYWDISHNVQYIVFWQIFWNM